MANPGVPGANLPAGEDWVPRALADLRREMREGFAAVASSFGPVMSQLQSQVAATEANVVSLTAQGVTLTAQQATLTAQGVTLAANVADIAVQQATLTTQQATLTTQQATLTAAVADINAIIGREVQAQAVYFSATGFGLTTFTLVTKASQTITVPTGFTSAAVSMVGRMYVINSTAAADGFYLSTKIDGAGGYGLGMIVAAGGAGTNVAPYSTVLTGLTGGDTFLLTIAGNSALANWAANGSNVAEMSGTITWYR